jgi:TM2 domain-containing membrane protein YozV
MSHPRSPYAALVLSAIFPGLGQIYNKQTAKGFVVMGSCVGLALLMYWQSGLNKITFILALLLLWASAITDAYKVARDAGSPSDFYFRKSYVVAMLMLIGPLALPLLWQSRHFSPTARWTWTIIVVGAALLFLATPQLMNWLFQHLPQL